MPREDAMDTNAEFAKLQSQHQDLESAIDSERDRPAPDSGVIATLKKQKLKIKDEMARLGAS
jgi:hypothetical protein